MSKKPKDKPENVITVEEYKLTQQAILHCDQGIAVVIKVRGIREDSEDPSVYPYFYQRFVSKYRGEGEFTKIEQKKLLEKTIDLITLLVPEEES